MMEASKQIEEYFERFDKDVKHCYSIATNARKKGFDPVDRVEILPAANMAERVEGLISTVALQIKGSGVVERIAELEKEYGTQDWRVALNLAEEISAQKFCKFETNKEAIEVGLRVGLAYITVGVVASPLEGFVKLEFKKRKDDGKEYFALYFSGPIRSAGTTATCIFVALCDYVRRKRGYAKYDPSDVEIKRFAMEVRDFHERVTNLQYYPSEQEVEFMVSHLPVMIDGDPSEKYEVSNYKDLDRMETNILRNGVCLVLAEGLTQKGPKFWKRFSPYAKTFGMEDWSWMEEFINLQKKIKAKGKIKVDSTDKITPDYTFIKDLVAGRPVLSHPLTKGGFRLRYGRTRLSGFSSTAIHPATMLVLENYIASGTQLKMERPGKSTVLAICDSIEGPVVKLKNGSVMLLKDEDAANKCLKDIDEVIFLGDILINYGDFFNRAHKLVIPGYCEEWWLLEFEKSVQGKGIVELSEKYGLDKNILKKIFKGDLEIKGKDAVELSKKLKLNLHPRYTYHWNEINKEELISLYNWILKGSIKRENEEIKKIILPLSDSLDVIDPKRALELIGIPHLVVTKEYVVIEEDDANALIYSLSLNDDFDLNEIVESKEDDVLKLLSKKALLKDKSGTFIGARMGRPEKAKMRKMTGSPHGLFPVGEEGGRMRSIQGVLEKGTIKAEFNTYWCEEEGREIIYPVSEKSGKNGKKVYYNNGKMEFESSGKSRPYKLMTLDFYNHFRDVLSYLKIVNYPDLIKGIRGTSNDEHISEYLGKAILRAIEDVHVNKDGTVRYDMTEMTITHFKPKEIGTSLEKLKKLGYIKDVNSNDLVDENQVIEIFPQDIILPACDISPDEPSDEVLFRVSKFVDNLLERLYKLEPYYNCKNKEDLVGHYVLAMSPHTSAGILGRIIGFSKLQGFLTHPLMHSIMRRDIDGDEACVVLLMDALLNFSRKLLPGHRGARQDAPLVLTTKLIPKEVDDMIFDMDVVWKYPLELYEAAEKYKDPWEIKIEQVDDRLGTEKQYEDYGYTHEISDFNKGVRCSDYKSLPTMKEKVFGQMRIAEKVRAVDESDVARLVIERHFMRDIRGNLRKFSQQQFRCVSCNEKYRRPPLIGRCVKCNGRVIFTISEGTIIKYVEPAMSLVEKYNLPPYLKQSLEITNKMIISTFSKDPEKQEGLGKWF